MQHGGVLVHCIAHENYVRIIFKHYTPGTAPVLLINHTKLSVINYWQRYFHFHFHFHFELVYCQFMGEGYI